MRDQVYPEFGRLVAERRKRARMTQAVFAKSLNLSRASIANIERGKQPVQLHLVFQIAAILGVEVQELIPSLDRRIPNIQVSEWLKRIDAEVIVSRSRS
jgi:transcriptional regulator with XRE-family HTH domain